MGVSIESKLAEIERRYRLLSEAERLRLLNYLSFYLTIYARGEYVDAGATAEQAAARLRGFNEAMHTVTGQILHLARPEAKGGYPVEDFFSIINHSFESSGCDPETFLGPIYDAFRQVMREQSDG